MKTLNICTNCGNPNDDGEGWDGLCGNCADKAETSKTLTYGTLPSFEEFAAGFATQNEGHYFPMSLNASDAAMFNALGLPTYGGISTDNKWACEYTAEQLYALCEALVATFYAEGTEFQEVELQSNAEWAGDFCSSILSTLGFEWQ